MVVTFALFLLAFAFLLVVVALVVVTFALFLLAFAFLLVVMALVVVAFALFFVSFVLVAVPYPFDCLGFVGRFQDNPRVAVFQRLKGSLQPGLKLQPVHYNQVRRPDRPQVRGRWLKPMRFDARLHQNGHRYLLAANSFREVAQRIDTGDDGQAFVVVRVLPARDKGSQCQENHGN